MNKEIIKKSEDYIEENNICTNTYKVSKAFIDGAKWYRDNIVNKKDSIPFNLNSKEAQECRCEQKDKIFNAPVKLYIHKDGKYIELT